MVCALVACGPDKIEVRQGETADYNNAAMLVAVDKFVVAGRTPAAYATLSNTAFELRSGMDRAVAKETELKLIALALAPVLAVQARPMTEQIDTLAITVWPTLLAPAFEADDLVFKRDPAAATLSPKPGEDASGYLLRLCGGPLSAECKHVVPELQGAIVASLAIRRATERMRNAVADCVMCGVDQGWHEAARTWEQLDRSASSSIHDIERRGDPDNWPVAGDVAEPAPRLPEAELDEAGEIVFGGQHYGAAQRIAALRDVRGNAPALALHLRPEMTLAQVRALLGDVRKAGTTRVAVVARSERYPWDRKIYWIADGVGTRAGLRPTDSLQLLLHAVDALASPGAVARVD